MSKSIGKFRKSKRDIQPQCNFIGFDDDHLNISTCNKQDEDDDTSIQSFSRLQGQEFGLFSHHTNCEQMMKLHETGKMILLNLISIFIIIF